MHKITLRIFATTSPPIVALVLDTRGHKNHAETMSAYIYILASKPNGILYVGVTNDLIRRVFEHRENMTQGFTKKHNVKLLVYYEEHSSIEIAIQREKNIKHWVRKWKIELIKSVNPNWTDLWGDITR